MPAPAVAVVWRAAGGAAQSGGDSLGHGVGGSPGGPEGGVGGVRVVGILDHAVEATEIEVAVPEGGLELAHRLLVVEVEGTVIAGGGERGEGRVDDLGVRGSRDVGDVGERLGGGEERRSPHDRATGADLEGVGRQHPRRRQLDAQQVEVVAAGRLGRRVGVDGEVDPAVVRHGGGERHGEAREGGHGGGGVIPPRIGVERVGEGGGEALVPVRYQGAIDPSRIAVEDADREGGRPLRDRDVQVQGRLTQGDEAGAVGNGEKARVGRVAGGQAVVGAPRRRRPGEQQDDPRADAPAQESHEKNLLSAANPARRGQGNNLKY